MSDNFNNVFFEMAKDCKQEKSTSISIFLSDQDKNILNSFFLKQPLYQKGVFYRTAILFCIKEIFHFNDLESRNTVKINPDYEPVYDEFNVDQFGNKKEFNS